MKQPSFAKVFVCIAFLGFSSFSPAQSTVPGPQSGIDSRQSPTSDERLDPKPEAKPYKVLTNGKKITVQATSNISKILVWTADGHRIIEQTRLSTLNYSFEVSIKEKIFFLLIELANGKRYTEKIGIK